MSSYPQSSPERGSIRAILVANSTERLYTHPLRWGAEQLKHLSVELHPLPPSLDFEITDDTITNFAPESGSQLTLSDIREVVTGIPRCRTKLDKDTQMREFIGHLSILTTGLQLHTGYLAFHYAGRAVADISVPLFFCEQSTPGLAWAYMDGTCTWNQRHRYHRLRKRSWKYATNAACEAKDLPLDPLYVAILIALAQKARKATVTGAVKTPNKVSLFVPEYIANISHEQSRSSRCSVTINQYAATITDEYLQKFDDPYHYHEGTLRIYHQVLCTDLHLAIYQALERPSRMHDRAIACSTVSKKRKALEDTTEIAKNVQRTKLDENRKSG